MDERRLIIVAGSGRSGTSLFSGILKALSCHVPQPEVAADNTNPRGFGEPQWVVDFHTALLGKGKVQTADARPAAWSDATRISLNRQVEDELRSWLKREFGQGDHVVIKDPRILWFLPLWTTVGEQLGVAVRYATVLRHPKEVVQSKQTYYGEVFHPTNRTAGWINTMLYTERATRDKVRTFTKYEDLLRDWTVEISKVASALDLKILERVGTKQIRVAADLVDPSLKRSVTDWDKLGVHKPVAELAEEVWELLDRVATKDEGNDPAAHREFDEMRQRYLEFYEMSQAVAQSTVLAARRTERENARASSTIGAQARGTAAKGKRKAKRIVRRVKQRIAPARK